MQLITGQKTALPKLMGEDTRFNVAIQCIAPFEIDLSCFGLTENNQLLHDDYMTFYNQPQTPQGEVQYQFKNNQYVFTFDLNKINNNQISRFIICATVSNEQLSLEKIQSIQVQLRNAQEQEVAIYQLTGSNFNQEKAVMLVEIYYKNDAWRFGTIGQGFNGGLKALIQHFGGEVEESQTQHAGSHEKIPEKIDRPSSILNPKNDLKSTEIFDKVDHQAPYLTELTKTSFISLEKHHLLDVKARVALVLDFSASMHLKYARGEVQKVLDFIMPLAMNFDDNGRFECWAFAENSLRLSDVSLDNVQNFIETEQGGHALWNAGARYNNEMVVLEEVLNYFTEQSPSELPVYVIFLSDSGIYLNKKVKQFVETTSSRPIFWQFVGMGGRKSILEQQSNHISGYSLDNYSYFGMGNIQNLSATELYETLLQEFSKRLKEAKTKNIL